MGAAAWLENRLCRQCTRCTEQTSFLKAHISDAVKQQYSPVNRTRATLLRIIYHHMFSTSARSRAGKEAFLQSAQRTCQFTGVKSQHPVMYAPSQWTTVRPTKMPGNIAFIVWITRIMPWTKTVPPIVTVLQVTSLNISGAIAQ